jgi:hypothetical protein
MLYKMVISKLSNFPSVQTATGRPKSWNATPSPSAMLPQQDKTA